MIKYYFKFGFVFKLQLANNSQNVYKSFQVTQLNHLPIVISPKLSVYHYLIEQRLDLHDFLNNACPLQIQKNRTSLAVQTHEGATIVK